MNSPVINPVQAEIYAGSEAIILTTDAIGSSLSYRWELRGKGSLQGSLQKPAISYIPPKTLTTSSEIVEILLTVADTTGQQTIASVSLTIYQVPQPSPLGGDTNVGKTILIGGAVIGGLGSVIAATLSKPEPTPVPEWFTGTFKCDTTRQSNRGITLYWTLTLTLLQAGDAINGTLNVRSEDPSCCTVYFSTPVTGSRIDATTAALTYTGTTSSTCTGRSCSYTATLVNTPDTIYTIENDGTILRAAGGCDYTRQ